MELIKLLGLWVLVFSLIGCDGVIDKFNAMGRTKLDANAPVITAKKILNEIERNKLRAIEKYKSNSSRIVGVMFSAEEKDSDYKIIVTADWDSTDVLYAIIPAKYKASILAVNSNDLVSMVCSDLQEFGAHAEFKNCDFFQKVDTQGVRNSTYLNGVIIKEEYN